MTQPIEPRTLTAALEDLRRRGFGQSLEASGGGIRVVNGRRVYRPQELTIVEHHRFEGVSDPDDMAVVYAIQATDGTRGVLVDAFGAYADPTLGEIVRQITDRAEERRAS
jgi:hypothetical protein